MRNLVPVDAELGLCRMKVLLVGGFGFIGRHLVNGLDESDEIVVFSDAEGAKQASGFRIAHRHVVEIGDVTNEIQTKDLILKHSPAAIVHLAALTGVKKCNENPSLAFALNVFGTHNVLMGCMACRCRLIYVSSREVYGETGSQFSREDDPLVPNNVYGLTKMLGERLVTWAGTRHGLDYTILRLTNVYGPGGDQYNVQAMIRRALTDGKIEIMGGRQLMNLVYVGDVVEVIRRCLVMSQASRETFNVGSHDNVSVDDLVSQLVSVLSASVKTERVPMRVGETLSFKPDLSKLERVLRYNPATTLSEGLRATVEWYRHIACS